MRRSKYAYYAAYSKNRAGLYTSWPRLESQQKYFKGIKYKGFYFIDEAVKFISDGICKDYKIYEPDQIDVSLLVQKKNYTFSIDSLKK